MKRRAEDKRIEPGHPPDDQLQANAGLHISSLRGQTGDSYQFQRRELDSSSRFAAASYFTPWRMVLAMRASSNSVRSPAFFPGTGSNRAARGLFHLKASVATSPTMRARRSSPVSPGSGTVSRPPAQTAEYASRESMLYAPSAHRRASTASSSTGTISPE